MMASGRIAQVGGGVRRAGLGRPALDVLSARTAYIGLGLFYVLVVAHRPLMATPESMYDDGLYMKLALQIASGHWLGPYDGLTLAKGPGFPIFLAIIYSIGLPFGTAVCLAYVAAAGGLCAALHAIVKSNGLRVLLFATLLFAPPLASSVTTIIERDFFYASLTLGYFAALIDMSFADNAVRRWRSTVLAGVLGGWIWITREEGVWLIPGVVSLAGVAFLKGARTSRWRVSLAWVLALILSTATVLSIGLSNRIVYGRFEIAEIKSAPFQSAMMALERASSADLRAYVPVPSQARARLYGAVPSFAKLQPVLDPPTSQNEWEHESCAALPQTCGEIAGGWFIWALRSAVEEIGMYQSPATADAFYTLIAHEVEGACRSGTLNCATLVPPLIPPMTMSQIRGFPRTIIRSIETVAMIPVIDIGWMNTSPAAGLDRHFVELIGATPYGPGRIVALSGQFMSPSASVLTVSTGQGAEIIEFHPPAMTDKNSTPQDQLSDFDVVVGCSADPCTLSFNDTGHSSVVIDLGDPEASRTLSLGSGHITISDTQASSNTLRTRLTNAINRSLPIMARFYTLLMLTGTVCFVAQVIVGLYRRSLSILSGIAFSLGIAAASRIIVIALVDASSFPAIGNAYLSPAFPMAISFSILSIASVASDWHSRRTRASALNVAPR